MSFERGEEKTGRIERRMWVDCSTCDLFGRLGMVRGEMLNHKVPYGSNSEILLSISPLRIDARTDANPGHLETGSTRF